MARLIESSLWVDFTRSKSPLALKTLIQPWILDPLACICEPVAFEVLRHATPQEQKWIKAQFETLPLLPTPDHLWRDATRLGQQCRAAGFNAGSLDLLIAALSIHHDAELITFDADYLAIAQASKLRVHHISRRGVPAAAPAYVPPLQGSIGTEPQTQGDALGWYGSHRWCQPD